MATLDNHYPLPHDLVVAIRRADVLTGQFIRPVPPEEMSRLEAMGLASLMDGWLTDRGRAVRRWVMCGAEHSSREVAQLLGETRSDHKTRNAGLPTVSAG